MNIKRSVIGALTAITLTFSAQPAVASGPEKEITIDQENFAKLSEAEQHRVLEIKAALEAIHNADRASMTREERKEMRSELKELNKEVKEINKQGPVIYISLTLLLVIVILILLLR